jgi:hypothetical protein
MRFAGAICSPNSNLRPTDVISSIFLENQQPRLTTKAEAELFFKFFMGLWDELFDNVKANKIDLSSYKKPEDADDFAVLCQSRYEEIEYGFVEGFWAGQENLKLPTYLAELMDSISQMAEVYMTLARKVENASIDDEVWKHFVATDKMVKKAIAFLVENSVLPRIDSLQRTVN